MFLSRSAIELAGDHGLPEGSRGCEHASVVRHQGVGGCLLFRGERSEKARPYGRAILAFVAKLGPDAVDSEQVEQQHRNTPRERDMLGEQLGTRDHARLAKGRQPHRLSRVEFRILKGRETDQTIDERWRQGAPVDVHLIAQDHLDPLRHLADDRLLGFSPRRRSRPRLLIVVIERKAHAQDPACGRRLVDKVGDLGSAHAPDARQECPLVLIRSQFIINEDAVAVLPGPALQRQRDQIAESASRHGVLAGKEPIIRIRNPSRPALHRLRHQMGTELARLGCRHGFREEDPDMTAIAGAGTFEDCGHTLLPACRQERQRIDAAKTACRNRPPGTSRSRPA